MEFRMLTHSRSRISPLRLAGIGAIAATALAAAPAALAASSGGAPLAPAAHVTKSAPFTIGLSSTTVKPGGKLTIAGLAYARAGLNLTIVSDAIASGRTANGIPAVQTPALVEGIYHTVVRIPPATEPGVYSVQLRFGNRQVASLNNLRVVAPGSHATSPTGLNRCAGIGFTVLHNDRAGAAYLPAGGYTVSSRNMDCGTASADFTSFLAGAGKPIAGWTTTLPAAGRATFTQRNSQLSFSVAKAAPATPAAARVATAHATTKPYSTVSVTPGSVTAGGKVTVTGNGPKDTHAGIWITLRSDAFASKTSVNGIPSIRAQVLVNGKYSVKATIRRSLKPTTYAVVGSYNRRDFDKFAWLKVRAQASRPNSTISVTPRTVRPGVRVTVTGDAPSNARAGQRITLMSDAFASKESVNGIPSIRAQVLVNGKYSVKATIRRSLKPTTYAITGSFDGKPLAQVAWMKVS
jgi:hypothetical protein